MVIFLDGAGHFTAGGNVKKGLRLAGYDGQFKTYVWTSFLGWGADHLLVAGSSLKAKGLADRIEQFRREHPDGDIHVMGLSAGTAVVLNALERLPEGTEVDTVVLFSSSVHANRDLTPALQHVRRALYATCSRYDLILGSLVITADGATGSPAGRTGFRIPPGVPKEKRVAYAKLVNLSWTPNYVAYGWNGGHVAATKAEFVKHVIAPRVMTPDLFPLDRPLLLPQDVARARDPQPRAAATARAGLSPNDPGPKGPGRADPPSS
jgi:pimeloyl-ACP methyl ester carboxylesterase